MDFQSRVARENWAQFALRVPETEAAALGQLEASLHLKRGWNVVGAANVFMLTKAAIWAVGQDVANYHRFKHRRWAPEHCGKICLAHDLYAYCFLCLPTDLHPRVMPISAILGRLIAQALRLDFAASLSFHREVTRDLSRLYSALHKPLAERSQADKVLLLRQGQCSPAAAWTTQERLSSSIAIIRTRFGNQLSVSAMLASAISRWQAGANDSPRDHVEIRYRPK